MSNAIDVLKERGFIKQITFENELYDLLEKENVSFYIGFDPTADSLHIGHYIPIMAMAHMQRAGHRPIALVGGGTAMVGDPSGKTDMRRMLTKEDIKNNSEAIKVQMSNFIDFTDDKAILINNADWLLKLNYVDFIRDIGVHFSVNRMLTADCYKSRLEKGLSFLEFNYMLMQSYDFLALFESHKCVLQMGGDDQWSNMLSGADLIRRKVQKPAYVCTFQLLTTSDGKKMGKTENGALWLSSEKTSPYDFYQYWRNVPDDTVEKCLALLTFLPMGKVRELGSYNDARINDSKRVLAYEVTKLIHGEDEAQKAQSAADALFSGGSDNSNIPSTTICRSTLDDRSMLIEIMVDCKITKSNGEGRRLIKQNAVSLNDEKVKDTEYRIISDDILDDSFMIKKGKKVFHRVIVK